MAYTAYPCAIPELLCPGMTAQRSAEAIIDADGEKLAMCGRVWIPDGVTRSIRRIHLSFSVGTKGATTALQVSLQDLDQTAGGPARPDGTADQTVTIPTADIATGWYRTGTLSADREVAHGAELAVVLEFSTFNAGDNIQLLGINYNGTVHQTIHVLYSAAAWARLNNVYPNVLLEFVDGTFGTLMGAYVMTAVTSTAYNSGSNPNELALYCPFPLATKVEGFTLDAISPAAGADFAVKLYEGTTERASVAFDSETVIEGSSGALYVPLRYTFAAATDYYLAVTPTTANNVTIRDTSVNDASHWAAHRAPTSWCLATRNGGAWTKITTRRPRFHAHVAEIETGSAGGGFPIFSGSIVR